MRLVKEVKRVAGMLLTRLPDLKLDRTVEDFRHRRGRRWRLDVILRTALVCLAAGCKSVAEIESLTERMSLPMRRKLGIARRLPDNTLRAVLLGLCVYDLRHAMRQLIQAAQKRKALRLEGLPFHVAALDGKATAIDNWDFHYAQRQVHEKTFHAYGLVRTVTSCLISTPAKPVLDAFPIPAETNESGVFGHALESLLRGYGDLFRLVTYDAGIPSEENCQRVVDADKDFCFRIKNENWLVYKDAQRFLGDKPLDSALAHDEQVVSNTQTVIRRVFLTEAPKRSWTWKSVCTLVRINVQTFNNGKLASEENKFYISSLALDVLTPKQWLTVTRGHWGVENHVHWTLDAIFREDERPFFPSDPKGTLVVMVLRRIVYNLLALFRSVTLRSEENRSMPWRALLAWVHDTLLTTSQTHLDGLRPRKELPTVAS